MSEMVERVARAIWQESVGRADWYKWETFRPDAWGRCLSMAQARAAIEAMREPTEAMIEAARNEDDPGFCDEPGFAAPHKDAWQAMIDAALK